MFESLPRGGGCEDKSEDRGDGERRDVRREQDRHGGGCGAGELVAADRPRHSEPKCSVPEQVDGDTAAKRDRAGRRQLIGRVGNE